MHTRTSLLPNHLCTAPAPALVISEPISRSSSTHPAPSSTLQRLVLSRLVLSRLVSPRLISANEKGQRIENVVTFQACYSCRSWYDVFVSGSNTTLSLSSCIDVVFFWLSSAYMLPSFDCARNATSYPRCAAQRRSVLGCFRYTYAVCDPLLSALLTRF